jgi:hypothetical protein
MLMTWLHPLADIAPRWAISVQHFTDPAAIHGSPLPAIRSDIRRAHAKAEKDSFVELDRHPQISLLEGEEWVEGVQSVSQELAS